MRKSILAISAIAAVSIAACAELTSGVQAACTDATNAGILASATVKGGATTTVSSINAYVAGGCATAEAVAKLAQDSSSVAWLQQQTASLKTLTPAPVAASGS